MDIKELNDLKNLLDFVANRPNMANLLNIEEVGKQFSQLCFAGFMGDEPTEAQKASAWEVYQAAVSSYIAIKNRIQLDTHHKQSVQLVEIVNS